MSVFEQIVKTRHIPHRLFDKGTRVVEVLNSLFLIGFATTLSAYWWIGMFTLGVVQFMTLIKTSLQSNQASGIILISSAWVWDMVAGTFIASLPSLTSAPIVYSIFTLMCATAGMYLLKINKVEEDTTKGCKLFN